jgi:hypothetical protein
MRNAALEGVGDRLDIEETGDMRALPFPDETFDIVVSSLAIHNIHRTTGRDRRSMAGAQTGRTTGYRRRRPRLRRDARRRRGRVIAPPSRVALTVVIRLPAPAW